jgi:hypothetical protein
VAQAALSDTRSRNFLLRLSRKAQGKEPSANRKGDDFSQHGLFSIPSTWHSIIDTRSFSFDHSIRSRQQNRQVDLLGGVEVRW